jgi:hypothetical protein
MDKKSWKSAKSTASTCRNKAKICGICGKKETAHFKRHCDTQHDGKQIVWVKDQEL